MRAVDAPPYPVVSVGRIASYIARQLGDDPKLKWVGVKGEITGLSPQPNGNVYFDLKDRDALIKCVAWSEAAAQLPPLANGQEIVAVGSIGTFAKRSTYQLVVLVVESGGTGRLHAMYEELKRKLQAEGLFALERKRALPAFPFRVGLVSSRAANGAGDFLAQAASLAPQVEIVLFETPVQGAAAAPEIVRAIGRASRADLDLVVLARGGGSYEDLFVFNDEQVVRALAACAHPTVAAIGHEADVTLADLVADHRSSTPSTAAQTVLPRRAEIVRRIETAATAIARGFARTLDARRRDLERIELRSPLADATRLLAPRRQSVDAAALDLQRAALAGVRARFDRLAALRTRLDARHPGAQLAKRSERLALARERLERLGPETIARGRLRVERASERVVPALRVLVERRRARLRETAAHLNGKDPTAILERGYAIVRTADGRAVRDAAALAPGALVHAQVARGTLTARVESTDGNGAE
jgi:exodeoxyribonuclease VII large subunit